MGDYYYGVNDAPRDTTPLYRKKAVQDSLDDIAGSWWWCWWCCSHAAGVYSDVWM